MSYIEYGSFRFGNIDMYDTYGIQILNTSMPEDLLIPSIRPRKVTVPLRHGQYDYGAKYYNERSLVLNCVTTTQYDSREVNRNLAREIAHTLSKKDEIYIWNEPDKYYIGRIENEVALTQIRDTAISFTLDFTCEPFAYNAIMSHDTISDSSAFLTYGGTVPAPTVIQIVYSGNTDVSNIKVDLIKKDGSVITCTIDDTLHTNDSLIIDSESYSVSHNNENIIHKHRGAWFDEIDRDSQYIRISSDGEDLLNFNGSVSYRERYL